MNKILLLLILLFLPILIQAKTFTVLIYREQYFPQDRYFYMTKSDGTKLYRQFSDLGNSDYTKFSDRQPFRATEYVLFNDNKNAILKFNPKKDSERTALYAWQNRGYIKIICIEDVVPVYNSAKGGFLDQFVSEILDSETYDNYRNLNSTTTSNVTW